MKCPVCKKNIPDTAIKCPYCKTRTGLVCSNCNTVNKLGALNCKNCKTELLKVCKQCNSVNFPIATKCRKCGYLFANPNIKTQSLQNTAIKRDKLSHTQAVQTLLNKISTNEIKLYSLNGPKGCGKSTVLKQVIQHTQDKFEWCIAKCSTYTQITPGGVIKQMLLNLFNLPTFYVSYDNLKKDATKIFANEFKFLNKTEISWLLNFLYNSNDGKYEDIIFNKKESYLILYKIFETIVNTEKFVFVIENLDYIDGFTIEFLTKFIQQKNIWLNLKLILTYTEPRSVLNFFDIEHTNSQNYYLDISLSFPDFEQIEEILNSEGYSDTSISEQEKYLISETCKDNPAFIEQAVFYCFDCQIANKEFITPKNFNELVTKRLSTLKSNYPEAYKVLSAAAILGEKIQPYILIQIFDIEIEDFNDIIAYLIESKFITKYNDSYYEFKNTSLWETIYNCLKDFDDFEFINIKVAKTISQYKLNTEPVLSVIAQNLKEHRMAFDIWTKITRLASFVGDINLYVIAQKQCLALLNEFNENETLNIRYSISERLGKLLTEYDSQSAIEYLPDAISYANTNNDDTKEIELLGYLAQCCKKTGNYYGDIECADNTLKKLSTYQEPEIALVKSTKLTSLLKIGNCGEVINIIDNDILPKLNEQLEHPRLDKQIPLELVYETKLKTTLYLAEALALQGNNKSFEVLSDLSALIKKHNNPDNEFICKIKLIKALANTVKGDYNKSNEILNDITTLYGEEFTNFNLLNLDKSEIINSYSLLKISNKLLQKDYQNIQEELFETVSFANDTGDIYTKHLLKTFLGKVFYDKRQAKHAIEIYNEEISYFAKEKLAIGALLVWYLIAQATLITQTPQKALEIAQQALEIAKNPRINNYFFIVLIKTLIAKIYINTNDYESAKINIEKALSIAKKYEMNDLLSKLYLLYGQYFKELGSMENCNKSEYLKGASVMFDRALKIVNSTTNNLYIKKQIEDIKNNITFC